MMDHILELDWSVTSADNRPYLVSEKALNNSCIEKILRNKFHDPLLSSDEEENEPNNIDWDAVFHSRDGDKKRFEYVPGIRPIASYIKLSTLSGIQHFHCLKVICAKNPQVLPDRYFNKPSIYDNRLYETLRELYEKEQKEFKEWAKTLWTTLHCSQALRLDPIVETVYEKEFNMRAHRMNSYPKKFDMAAQIPLECSKKSNYDASTIESLVSVNVSGLPRSKIPERITEYTSIIKPGPVPEPCYKHPYHFILPTEKSVSMLPMTEIHRELAQYAAENGTRLIASENALQCLLAFNRHWTIPISVWSTLTPDGVKCNVVVLDSEFNLNKEPAMIRTLKAYRHLLLHTLVPSSELEKVMNTQKKKEDSSKKIVESNTSDEEAELLSDDEVTVLVIHEDYDDDDDEPLAKQCKREDTDNKEKKDSDGDGSASKDTSMHVENISMSEINNIVGVYSCTCKDTVYESPPQRSYKKWRFTNTNTLESIDMIIHCPHKARVDKYRELIMEPHPEYQLELGGSEQQLDDIRRDFLALLLRKKADLLKVRVDGYNGELVTIDAITAKDFKLAHSDTEQQVLNVIHSTLGDLQGLMPGHYVLRHEPSHGTNALLYVARPNATGLSLDFNISQLLEPDEAKVMTTPPTITPVLLPFHKARKILPCAFTPYGHQLAKETKKPPPPPPPKPSKYPKRKNKNKKNKNSNVK